MIIRNRNYVSDGSRRFGGATGDRVDFGSPTHLDNLPSAADGFTVLSWVYRTADGANLHIATKDQNLSVGGWIFIQDNAPANGTLRFIAWKPGGTGQRADYISSGGEIPLNTWKFAGVTYQSSASTAVKLYHGGINSKTVLATNSLAQNGTGTLGTDAAANFYVGNVQRTNIHPWKGNIAVTRVYDRALTQAEVEIERRLYAAPSRHPHCIFDAVIGSNIIDRKRRLSKTLTASDKTVYPGLPLRSDRSVFIPSAGVAGSTISGALSSGTSSVAGSVDVVKPVSGALSSGTSSVAGSVDVVKPVSGALSSGTSSVAGSVDVVKPVSGALSSGTSSVAGSVDVVKPVSGSLSSGTSSVAGSVDVVKPVSGSLSSGTSSVAGSVNVVKPVSGALSSGTSSVAGSLISGAGFFISGDLLLSSSLTEGSLSVIKRISGATSASSATSEGSITVSRDISGNISASQAAVSGNVVSGESSNVLGQIISGQAVVSGQINVVRRVAGSAASGIANSAGQITSINVVSGSISCGLPVVSGYLLSGYSGEFVSGNARIFKNRRRPVVFKYL